MCLKAHLSCHHVQALVCRHFEDRRARPLIKKLSKFVPSCGLSYLGLITGSDVDKISLLVNEGNHHLHLSTI